MNDQPKKETPPQAGFFVVPEPPDGFIDLLAQIALRAAKTPHLIPKDKAA